MVLFSCPEKGGGSLALLIIKLRSSKETVEMTAFAVFFVEKERR